MQFRLTRAVICLDQQAARLAVRDAAFEACFEARAGAEDDDGGDFAVLLPSVGGVALGSFYGYPFEADEFHCSGELSVYSQMY